MKTTYRIADLILKWIIMITLISMCQRMNAQHTISVTLAGSDMAIGGRYDYQFNRIGIYTGFGMGHYNTMATGITEHKKASFGIVRYIPRGDFANYFSIGINAHKYKQEVEGPQKLSDLTLFPVCMELGCGGIIKDRFSMGFTFDPIKHDGMFNLGIRFGL